MKELVENKVKNMIHFIRGKQVMLDRDLAELYGVSTKSLNRTVKRNIKRFPKEFMFQLIECELENLRFQNGTSRKDSLRFQNGTLKDNIKFNNNIPNLRSQNATSKEDPLRSQIVTLENGRGKHRKYLPYAFTEQGIAMLSAILRSDTAIKVKVSQMVRPSKKHLEGYLPYVLKDI